MAEVVKEYKGYTRGRNSGAVNFLEEEDVILAKVWAEVISEDDGAQMLILWPKVTRKFRAECETKAIPNQRNSNSLRNRFLTLQQSISKYVPCLQKAMEKYRAGWVLSKYEKEARSLYLSAHGKRFKHELAYNQLKHVPKFRIDLELVSPEVRSALQLDLLFEHHDQSDTESAQVSASTNEVSSPTIVKTKSKRLKLTNEENESVHSNDGHLETPSCHEQRSPEPLQPAKVVEQTTEAVVNESTARLQQYMQHKLLQSLPKDSMERRAIELEMAKSLLLDIQIANAAKTIKLNELKRKLATTSDNDAPNAEDTETTESNSPSN